MSEQEKDEQILADPEEQFEIYPLEGISPEYYPLQDWIRWRLFNGKLTNQETKLIYEVLMHPELQDQIKAIIVQAEESTLIKAAMK